VIRELHCGPSSSFHDALRYYQAPVQLEQLTSLQHAGLDSNASLWTPTRDRSPNPHQHYLPSVSGSAGIGAGGLDSFAFFPCYGTTLYNSTNNVLTTDPCGIPTDPDPTRPAVSQTRAVPHIELPNNNNLPCGLIQLASSPKALPLRPRSLSFEPSRISNFDRPSNEVQQNQNTSFLQTPNPLNNGLSRHRSAPSKFSDRHNARSKNDRRRRSRSRSTHSWPETQTPTNLETPLYSNADTSKKKQCPECDKLLHDERGLQ
jgi:hypothetical protein